jgi:hypothetical protein
MADDEKPMSALDFGTLMHWILLGEPDEELGFGHLMSMRPRRGEVAPIFHGTWNPGGWVREMLDRIQKDVVVYIPCELPPDYLAERWPTQSEAIQLLFKSPDCAGYALPLEGKRTIDLVHQKDRDTIKGREFSFFWDDLHSDVATSNWPPGVEEVPEFKGWGPGDARIGNALVDIKTYGRRPAKSLTVGAYHGLDDPVPYVVEFGDALPFHHQVLQRPWSTPNRKRFKRANRRKK